MATTTALSSPSLGGVCRPSLASLLLPIGTGQEDERPPSRPPQQETAVAVAANEDIYWNPSIHSHIFIFPISDVAAGDEGGEA